MDDLFIAAADLASAVCYATAALGCLYALFAAWSAHGFVRVRSVPAGNYPPITVLKPLHGVEPNLYANLARFCVQDYPSPVQIVFGVDDPNDPAIAVVHRLIAAHPGVDLQLVVNSRRHGSNRKVSNLINMVAEARHEILIICDSDIIVESNYLKSIVAPLERPGVGLVTCLYRGAAASGPWARLAAAAIDYHFLPGVLVGLRLGLAEPCFGSTIALRRRTLAAIGGLESVVEELADDYALGILVRRTGLRVAIPSTTVAHDCVQNSAVELFRQELRWARTIRSVDPLGFFGMVITHALPLAFLGVLFGGITPASVMVIVALACRFVLQTELARVFYLREDLSWMGPLRDMLSFAVFVVSFFGRDVEWRGHRYALQSGSTLAYYGEAEP